MASPSSAPLVDTLRSPAMEFSVPPAPGRAKRLGPTPVADSTTPVAVTNLLTSGLSPRLCLRHLGAALGWDQTALAAQAGTSTRTLQRWLSGEVGEHAIPAAALMRLAAALQEQRARDRHLHEVRCG